MECFWHVLSDIALVIGVGMMLRVVFLAGRWSHKEETP